MVLRVARYQKPEQKTKHKSKRPIMLKLKHMYFLLRNIFKNTIHYQSNFNLVSQALQYNPISLKHRYSNHVALLPGCDTENWAGKNEKV
jgi:hypothetical protein